MPFGLSNAPQTMSKLMDKVIPPNLRNEIFIYLDDLLVISETFEKHVLVLRSLADRLSQAGLTINVEKTISNSPYRVAFGQHMITNGNTYPLLRNLQLLEDRTVSFDRKDSFDLIRKTAQKSIQRQHEQNEKQYNLRSREVDFKVGQEVYRRNFQQSNFAKGFNAKLAPALVKSRIKRKLGNSFYELEDNQGRFIGKYHAKDIKQ
ncbi:hypothetical protein KR044_006893 [Drosophila immigrans]|nr:hypothetical protein KR044_006893 [Drosophila immigrans]